MSRNGVPYEDLFQEGMCALDTAVERFNLDMGARFSTYARWWLITKLQSYVKKTRGHIALPTSSKAKKIYSGLIALYHNHREELDAHTAAVIAEGAGATPEEVWAFSAMMQSGQFSLNQKAGSGSESDVEILDLIEDDARIASEETHLAHDRRRVIEDIIEAHLDDRSATIVRKRFLCDPNATLGDLGAEFGVTRERIRQIERDALKSIELALYRKRIPKDALL
jgi:RNA polymerase sigma-32 factor